MKPGDLARRFYEFPCAECGYTFETTNPEDTLCMSCVRAEAEAAEPDWDAMREGK